MFIVIPFPIKGRHNLLDNGVYAMNLTSKTRPTIAYASLELAEDAARKMAEANPELNIAVMGVVTVTEAKKAEVTFVRKVLNSSGELVPEVK